MVVDKNQLRSHLYDRDGRKCHYCGIAEADFISIWGKFYGGNKRGSILEIDNCVLACAICDNAKSDKFTCEEFKSVGKVIRRIWKSRKRGFSDTVH